jgi:putative NIF3 family GTP cyclohydrolase 1 type 2
MNVKIQDILDALTNPVEKLEQTVDKLEYGNSDSTVTGVAVTFLATQEIIETAKGLGANLIISHEGIFFSHWDKREMLKEDPVYKKKLQTIEESSMAIFRFHDYIHKYRPDGITRGLIEALQWKDYEAVNEPAFSVLEIPEMPLSQVIAHAKECLGAKYVRFVGNLNMPCKRIGILVGYRGSGDHVIPLFEKEKLDLVIYGEGPEWEAPEYVRDALQQGRQKSLLVLGHAESEAVAMKYLAQWLQEKFPSVDFHYIPSKPIFQVL